MTGDNAVKGNSDVSIIALRPVAIEAAETVDTAKPAIVPTAVFIFVEAILVVETVLVILLKEFNPGNPGAALITLLLTMALLGNFVCGVVAARAAGFVRQFEHARHAGAPALTDWSSVIDTSGEAIGVPPEADIAGVDIAAAEDEPRTPVET